MDWARPRSWRCRPVDLLLIADDRLADERSAAAVVLGAMRRALLDGQLDPDRVAEAVRRVSALAERVGAGPR